MLIAAGGSQHWRLSDRLCIGCQVRQYMRATTTGQRCSETTVRKSSLYKKVLHGEGKDVLSLSASKLLRGRATGSEALAMIEIRASTISGTSIQLQDDLDNCAAAGESWVVLCTFTMVLDGRGKCWRGPMLLRSVLRVQKKGFVSLMRCPRRYHFVQCSHILQRLMNLAMAS